MLKNIIDTFSPAVLVFINVYLVCKIFSKNKLIFEEVTIILCLIIVYQPHICPKDSVLVTKLLL